ncbi:MAG: hypothetical protein MZU95_13580 [Desulfomicrobium escambiense]|nr:hypothetical protein [Desulfomicrobium escambiense]
MAVAALEEGVITPDFTVTCRGGATFYGRFFQCHLKGGHGTVDLRHAHREVVQHVLLHDRQHGRRRSHQQVGRRRWASRAARASTCRTRPRASCRPPPGRRRGPASSWYAGETISVAIGQGQVSVTPLALAALYAAVGERRHPLSAAPAEGHRRRRRMDAGRPASAAGRQAQAGDRSPRCTTGCGSWSTAPARAGAHASRGATWRARPARRR